jgi:hypothetical protein
VAAIQVAPHYFNADKQLRTGLGTSLVQVTVTEIASGLNSQQDATKRIPSSLGKLSSLVTNTGFV